MSQKSKVKIEWAEVELNLGDTWGALLLRFQSCGLSEEQLQKCVYVIRVDGLFAIRYKNGPSPVIYIGQGQLKNRIKTHMKWLEELRHLVQDFTFRVCVCVPKDEDDLQIRKDLEAALIHKFSNLFGSIPLRNQKLEYEQNIYCYWPQDEFVRPLKIGRGKRFYWAIEPMNANKYSRLFGKRANFE